MRIWAHGNGLGHGWSEAFEVAPGRDLAVVVLVAPALTDADWIRGHVLSPHGEPVPHARVGFSYSTPSVGGGSEVRADGEGRFQLLA